MCLFHFLETKPASLFLFQQPLPHGMARSKRAGWTGQGREVSVCLILLSERRPRCCCCCCFLTVFLTLDSFSSFFPPSPRQVYQRAAQNSATHDRSVQPSRLVIGVSTTASRRCRVSSLGGARHRNWANGPEHPFALLAVCVFVLIHRSVANGC